MVTFPILSNVSSHEHPRSSWSLEGGNMVEIMKEQHTQMVETIIGASTNFRELWLTQWQKCVQWWQSQLSDFSANRVSLPKEWSHSLGTVLHIKERCVSINASDAGVVKQNYAGSSLKTDYIQDEGEHAAGEITGHPSSCLCDVCAMQNSINTTEGVDVVWGRCWRLCLSNAEPPRWFFLCPFETCQVKELTELQVRKIGSSERNGDMVVIWEDCLAIKQWTVWKWESVGRTKNSTTIGRTS